LKAKEPQIDDALKQLRQKLEESKNSFQASSSRGKVLTSLLKQRDMGRIRGIYVIFSFLFLSFKTFHFEIIYREDLVILVK